MKTSLIVRRDERPAIRRSLESAGFLVFDVADAGRDRDRLRAILGGAILLDLPTPRMRGLEVVRGLRSAGDDTPGLIVLTHGRIPATIAAVRLGAVDVLAKPLTFDALRAAVDDILRRAGSRSGPDPARPGSSSPSSRRSLTCSRPSGRWTAGNSTTPSGSSSGPSIGTRTRPWPIT